ncbi:MAG: LysR family transcriptional regulator [Bdellovibrionales bacterium]|nr:LysR family transcriptional regulator [Bdellovibrionales bacterium]
MSVNFFDITYFIEVAETANISRAAEKLGITQPSLSTAIKRLETELGAPLFLRNRSGVILTPSGKDFLNKGRQLLQHWHHIQSEIYKTEHEIRGRYILGCHPSVSLYTLGHFLPELLQTHPDLEIVLEHDLSRKITEQVISHQIDFGIVVNPVLHSDLVVKPLCNDTVRFWRCKKPSPTQMPETANALLIADPHLTQAQTLIKKLRKAKVEFPRFVSTSSLEVATELTSKGLGIGILPERVVRQYHAKELVPVSDDWPIYQDKICLVYRSDYQKTGASKEIISRILKHKYQ